MVTPFFGRTLYNALDTAVEVQTKRTKWADLGDRGDAYVAAYLEQDGFEILGRQVWVRTSAGIRITDFIVTGGAFGTQLVGVEVKVNTSAERFRAERGAENEDTHPLCSQRRIGQ